MICGAPRYPSQDPEQKKDQIFQDEEVSPPLQLKKG